MYERFTPVTQCKRRVVLAQPDALKSNELQYCLLSLSQNRFFVAKTSAVRTSRVHILRCSVDSAAPAWRAADAAAVA